MSQMSGSMWIVFKNIGICYSRS